MIIHNFEQRTEEWYQARLGLITASDFDKLITPTGKASTQMNTLVNKKVAEIVTGKIEETYQSDAMARGSELEDEALEYFNFVYGLGFEKVGFVSKDGIGCSPDALNQNEKYGLEMKCPLIHTQVDYLIDGKLPNKYKAQVQGSMLVTGYDRWYFGSYHPDLKDLFIEVKRDNEYIEKLYSLIFTCLKNISIRVEKIKSLE